MGKANIGVILCGGVGERFWPLSDEKRPKYALPLAGKKTLLAATYARIARIHGHGSIYVATDRSHARLVKKLLPGLTAGRILTEPLRRNTAGAVTLASIEIAGIHGPDAVITFYPADAMIHDAAKFAATLSKAQAFARRHDRIVMAGIRPTYPATGYGYIEARKALGGGARAVGRFVEKPGLPAAKRLLASKRFLWNAGIFTWKASVFAEEMQKHAPGYLRHFESAFRAGRPSASALKSLFGRLPSEPIDRLLVEKSRRLAVFPAAFDWDDIGTWEALRRIAPDSKGNVLRAKGAFDDVRNTVIFSQDLVIAACGLDGVVVAQKGPYLLIAGPGKSQDVRTLRNIILKRQGRRGI